MDSYRSPVVTYDMANQATGGANFHNAFGRLYSHLITVDSRERNRNFFVNPNSFELKMKTPLKNVYSVELLKAVIPIIGTERTVYLFSKRLGTLLQPMEPKLLGNDYGVPETDAFHNPVADDNVIAEIALVPSFGTIGAATTLWETSQNNRFIKHYTPPLGLLSSIDFKLFVRGNTTTQTPYGLADEVLPAVTTQDGNWSMLFEIQSQN